MSAISVARPISGPAEVGSLSPAASSSFAITPESSAAQCTRESSPGHERCRKRGRTITPARDGSPLIALASSAPPVRPSRGLSQPVALVRGVPGSVHLHQVVPRSNPAAVYILDHIRFGVSLGLRSHNKPVVGSIVAVLVPGLSGMHHSMSWCIQGDIINCKGGVDRLTGLPTGAQRSHIREINAEQISRHVSTKR